jgi:hypothetical protein
MNIIPFENIKNYFNNIRAINKAEREHGDAEFRLHQKKTTYIDSLQLNMERMFNGSKTIISSNNKVDGYLVSIGTKFLDCITHQEHVRPDMTIGLEANSIDDMTLTVWEHYRDNELKKFSIRNDTDYTLAKRSILDYICSVEGSKFLKYN